MGFIVRNIYILDITYNLTMVTKARLKTWGSSLGIVVPSDVVKSQNLKEGEEILVEIKKKHTVGDLFGALCHWGIDPQQVKDELRKDWAK
jgi:hypothetical protein